MATNYTYQGCFNDSGNRAIPNRRSQVNSVAQCAQQAIANNETLFGVQYGGQCFTGTDLTKAQQYGRNNGNCGTLGGSWTNQLYTLPQAEYVYQGCYNDKGSRAIPNRQTNVNSVSQCANIASSKGESVFGVQYGGQCFTGTDLTKAKQYGRNNGNCGTLGGSWTNQVYEKKPGPKTPNMQQRSGLYDYKGCYNDTRNRAIPNYRGQVKNVDQCQALAVTYKDPIFGVQYYGQCFTGGNEQQAYQYGVNNNSNTCPPLGGAWTNQVYVRNVKLNPFLPPIPRLSNPNFSEKFTNGEENDMYDNKENIVKYISIIIIIILFLFLIYHIYSL